MQTSFAPALAFTLQSEGGWSDDPDDPGGATNKGITFATFLKHYPGASIEDLKSISDTEVSTIYKAGYWDAVHGDDLPAGVDLSVFDFGVNAGPPRAIEMLQRAAGVDDDGIIGPATLAAVKAIDPVELIRSLAKEQQTYYEGLSTFWKFGRGWTTRTAQRQKAALALITAEA